MNKRYALPVFVAGALAARTGDGMSGPALLLAGYALTGSATGASALLAGITVAAVVGGPVLGALLDRAGHPGRMLAGSLVLYATGLGVILAGLGRWPFAVTLLTAVLTGLAAPALSGGWTAQLPEVVAPDRLPGANASDAMTFGAASLAGPALAGVVAEALGAPAALVVSAVLVGAAVPVAWTLPHRPGPRIPDRAATILGDLVAGARTILSRPALARATLVSILSCTAQGMLTACLVPLGEHVLGGAGRGAVLLTCAAVAALTANAVLAGFPSSLAPDTIVWAAALVQAAALVLAARAGPALLLGAVLLAGAAEGPQLAAVFAIRHRESPPRLRGQIFSTGAGVKLTGFALGAAVAGPAGTWSLPGTLLLAAGVSALAVPAAFAIRPPSRSLRRR
ncbi:MFS transporter [Streptomyces sp. NBC_00102]|uniref:MFS transporter n=1 Tax=Streptomyces sp. NBC_00102 TaxID=2975652 RepID=UPI002256E3D9|nr:MFS transporter [Streptomyces sp. NBC_00102]MCX5401949.1 MFS transporter [Streptomyces sp. NBC_00102]